MVQTGGGHPVIAGLHVGLAMQGGGGWAGGAEYVCNLHRALCLASERSRIRLRFSVLQLGRVDERWRKQLVLRGAEILELPALPLGIGRFGGLGSRLLRSVLRQNGIEFLFPLTYENQSTLGVDFPLEPVLKGVGWAGWIPDFQHLHLAHLFQEADRARRDAGIRFLGREAPVMVLSSEAAAGEYRRFFPEAQAEPFVLRFCTFFEDSWYAGDVRGVQARHGVPGRYFLVSNQFWAHKNHETLFKALGLLRQRGVRPAVVCTGALEDYRNREHVGRLRSSLRAEGVEGQVHFLGLTPREEQIQLMRGALAVLQPSRCEGWSPVVEDARLLGKDLVLSDLAVHREQAPAGGRYAPALAVEEWADEMARAWNGEGAGHTPGREQAARLEALDRQRLYGERALMLIHRVFGGVP